MCKCRPNVRTPFCGRPGCEWPTQTNHAPQPEPGMIREQIADIFEPYVQSLKPFKDKSPIAYSDVCDALEAIVAEAVIASQTNAVAWTVSIVDELHWCSPASDDPTYKGVKNTIRDRYKSEIGVDPAPNYPVKPALTAQLEKETK